MIQAPSASTGKVDAPSAVAAASYLIALSQLIINVQPLTMGALADAYQLSDRQLGYLSATFVGFATLCTMTGPLWIRRINWRAVSLAAVLASAAVLAAGAMMRSAATYLVLFAVLGVVKSLVGIPSFASLGDSSNPDRNYGVSVAVQSFAAAVVAAALGSFVIPQFGVTGLFITLAVAVGTGAIACRWLPVAGPAGRAVALTGTEARIRLTTAGPAVLSLLALGLFIGGILGFWYFVERIGVSHNVSVSLIGLSLSLSALATITTAAVVAWLGGRVGSMVFITVGTLLVLLGFAILQVAGTWPFVAAVLLFSLGWGLAQPAYWAVARKVDASNRLFVAAPAVGGAAGVLVGVAAGPVIESGGYELLVLLSGVLLATGAVCASLALQAANRRARRESAQSERPALV